MGKIAHIICWVCWFCFAYLFYGNVINMMTSPSPAPKLCTFDCFNDVDGDLPLLFLGSLIFLYACLLLIAKLTKPASDTTNSTKRFFKGFFLITFYLLTIFIPLILVVKNLIITSENQQHGEFVGLLYFVLILAGFIFFVFHYIITSTFLWLITPIKREKEVKDSK